MQKKMLSELVETWLQKVIRTHSLRSRILGLSVLIGIILCIPVTTRSMQAEYWTYQQSDEVVVFSSEADGDAEIYTMDLVSGRLRQLTHNSVEDTGPRWSPDGSKIAFVRHRDGSGDIYVMDANGSNALRLVVGHQPTWSPDGRRIAYTLCRRDIGCDLYVVDVDGSNRTRLTFGTSAELEPAWSPDGRQIVFSFNTPDGNAIYVMDTDGSDWQQITPDGSWTWNPAWSPDGDYIAYEEYDDIHVLEVESGATTRVTEHRARDFSPAWYADGSRIAFVSDRSGNYDIYSCEPDGSDVEQLIDMGASTLSPDMIPAGAAPIDYPSVIIMDGTYHDLVFHTETLKDGGTNADDIADILASLPIDISKEETSSQWQRDELVHAQNPDLIIIHRTAFFDENTGSYTNTDQFSSFLQMANTRTVFLIYSRAFNSKEATTAEEVEEAKKAEYEEAFPRLRGRIEILLVLGKGNARWDTNGVDQRLKEKVMSILALN